MQQMIMMGNEAIGRGLAEEGCSLFAAYPGTPSSEILPAVARFSKDRTPRPHIEWSVNEKAAFEVALAASYTGKRAAVAMKQVGLNVAADPFTRSAYLGVIGGFLVIVADDPGPHSSQTEQDSRLFAHFAKIPVFDPSSPREAKEMIGPAFDLSERYEIPVMIRPTTRVCHSRQNVPLAEPARLDRKAAFRKDPGRWVATPAFLTNLHRILNDKIDRIAREAQWAPRLAAGGGRGGACVIASGTAFAHAMEILEDLGPTAPVDVYQATLPYPLHRPFIDRVRRQYGRILVLEETDSVIELQLPDERVSGRANGLVPREGELTPEAVEEILARFLDLPKAPAAAPPSAPGKRPTLCAGCPHRAAFYTIRKTFPKGIFPSDIGCYTLGMNLGAIDTCHVMGACISQGAGFYHAYAQDGGDVPPIVVTIGDSTFFHAGIPGLVNAVFQGSRFVLVILDNATTAMTGNQPTPAGGFRADGTEGIAVAIPDLVKACGVRFLRECDPYDVKEFGEILREADRHTRSENGSVAVILARHPCVLQEKGRPSRTASVTVTEACTGCRHCVERFECPAIGFDEAGKRAFIDGALCNGCGVCLHVCPVAAIRERSGA